MLQPHEYSYLLQAFEETPTRTNIKIIGQKRGTIRTHWYADDLLKQYPCKGDTYVIDEELQHTDHLFLGVACFTF